MPAPAVPTAARPPGRAINRSQILGAFGPSRGSPPSTHAAPSGSAPTTNVPRMQQGEIREVVRQVQLALFIRGYDPGPIDGIFGAKTQAALRAFQSSRRLAMTGQIDGATLDALAIR